MRLIMNSPLIKLSVIGILILVLLIPMQYVRGLVAERQEFSRAAQSQIQSGWGDAQTIIGPIFRVETNSGIYRFLLPEEQKTQVDLQTELRSLGIFEVPVYRARLEAQLHFRLDDQESETFKWETARLIFLISNSQAVQSSIILKSEGRAGDSFVPMQNVLAGFQGVELNNVPLQEWMREGSPLNFSLEWVGSKRFECVPAAKKFVLNIHSNWSEPGFIGFPLPREREWGPEGFTAQWRVAELAHRFPVAWSGSELNAKALVNDAFGVTLHQSASIYQIMERITKYAILFFVLTFGCYFLFELLQGIALHPIQYLLVGCALCLFYVLVLALGEHMAFHFAYFTAASALTGLVCFYSAGFLERGRGPLIIGVVLFSLYGYLFIVLAAADFALLLGSLALFVLLASFMTFTRRTNWFQVTKPKPPPVPHTSA
ncbi:MAG: inner membrane CreD family protein [Acidobacteria bacterium]|nr:inner membrane CreD family protein [Acidobacteriota bacterium]MCB9398330.1 inner membrane CreD family protein [Acidobacteriota bacterium]